MFTQRALLLGVVAFCFYLIAVVNSLSSFYYALTWLSMAMLAASAGVALLSLVGVKCELELTRTRGSASLGKNSGVGAQVALAISNCGTLNKTNIILELRVLDTQKATHYLRFLLEAIPSGAAIESVLPLSRLPRGRYQLQDARLIGSDVLGLFRMQKKVELSGESVREIMIGPPILETEVHLQEGSSGFLAGQKPAFVARHGEEMRGTRPYAPGDDLRHVHWKSSARAGELVVKEWERTSQSGALIIWDGAAQTSWGQGDFNSAEWGLILTASLCRAFLAAGTPCDVALIDEAPLLVEARSLIGGDLPAELTEALSAAHATRTASLEAALKMLSRLAARPSSTVVVVSASLSVDLVHAVAASRARGSHVEVFLIDGASLAERSNDPQFRSSASKLGVSKAPFLERDGKKLAISRDSFQDQLAHLRASGATVVSVVPSQNETARGTLLRALGVARDTPGIALREE